MPEKKALCYDLLLEHWQLNIKLFLIFEMITNRPLIIWTEHGLNRSKNDSSIAPHLNPLTRSRLGLFPVREDEAADERWLLNELSGLELAHEFMREWEKPSCRDRRQQPCERCKNTNTLILSQHCWGLECSETKLQYLVSRSKAELWCRVLTTVTETCFCASGESRLTVTTAP